MLEALINIDTSFLLWINSFHTAFGDVFMSLYTNKWVWIPLYLFLGYYLYKGYGKQAWGLLLALVLCVALADVISSSIIKPLVARPRPSHLAELEGILHIVNGYRGGQFGFVSAHAANTIVVVTFFGLLTRDTLTTLVLLFWSLLNCYSRIYLGVHYPGDILCGLLLGILIASIVYALIKHRISKIPITSLPPTPLCRWGTFAIWVFMVGLFLLYSTFSIL